MCPRVIWLSVSSSFYRVLTSNKVNLALRKVFDTLLHATLNIRKPSITLTTNSVFIFINGPDLCVEWSICYNEALFFYDPLVEWWLLYYVGQFMVLNANNNNISAISWQSVLLMEETGVPGENQQPAASHWQTLSHNVVSSTPSHGVQTWEKRSKNSLL
jgi:hypothetical protein